MSQAANRPDGSHCPGRATATRSARSAPTRSIWATDWPTTFRIIGSSDFASRRALLTLRYYYHFDDQFFLMFPRKGTGLEHPDALLRNWRGEFAAQYRRGRYFHMTLHPQHIGWSNRLQMLDEFLAELRGYPGLWNPTAAECARYWLETYPASAHLRLAPSIWQDYPGSLS